MLFRNTSYTTKHFRKRVGQRLNGNGFSDEVKSKILNKIIVNVNLYGKKNYQLCLHRFIDHNGDNCEIWVVVLGGHLVTFINRNMDRDNKVKTVNTDFIVYDLIDLDEEVVFN